MSDLQGGLKNIMSDIEHNMKEQEDIEFAKTQIYNMYNLFMNELEKIEEENSKKMDSIFVRYSNLEERLNSMEDSIERIEDELYINDEECGFDIICPYCDEEIYIDCSEELKNEVSCPKCNNTIELDWNDEHEHECGCSHGCCGCDEGCQEEDEDM